MATGWRLPELRLLLIGRTGHGKSSTGNSILDKDVFVVSETSQSCTKEARTEEADRFGRTIRVTDTPGYFDTELSTSSRSQENLRKLLMKCLFTTIPGLDGILFVLRKGEKFTPELQQTQQLFFDWFGPGVEDYAYLVITHCDSQEDADKYALDGSHDSLRSLARRCGDRIIPIENKGTKRTEQIRQMIDRIRKHKERNGGVSFADIKYNIITHIAETRDPREITQESLLILKKAKPDVERFMQSRGFKIINSEGSRPIPIIDESTPTGGNLTILDDSLTQSGLYHPDQPRGQAELPSISSSSSNVDQNASSESEDNDDQHHDPYAGNNDTQGFDVGSEEVPASEHNTKNTEQISVSALSESFTGVDIRGSVNLDELSESIGTLPTFADRTGEPANANVNVERSVTDRSRNVPSSRLGRKLVVPNEQVTGNVYTSGGNHANVTMGGDGDNSVTRVNRGYGSREVNRDNGNREGSRGNDVRGRNRDNGQRRGNHGHDLRKGTRDNHTTDRNPNNGQRGRNPDSYPIGRDHIVDISGNNQQGNSEVPNDRIRSFRNQANDNPNFFKRIYRKIRGWFRQKLNCTIL